MNRLFDAALLCLVFIGGTAVAQDSSSLEGLSIEAQPLASALREFSEQTGLQIGYAAELAEGKDTDGVEGIEDPEIALNTLLAGSGLEHRFVNDSTVIIRDPAATYYDGSDRNPKNLSLTPVLTTTNVEKPAGSINESQAGEATTGASVSGQVKASPSWANLKGARVEIVETGQRTATDDLGRFRFPSVAPGEYTLRITYLSRDPLVEKITVGVEDFNQIFAMSSENTLDTIVVYGSRSARAQALNQERTASNSSTVLSSDFLGSFDGVTVSEALRRAPGIAFQQSDITGEGTNIIVRGLEPDLNSVSLNGLRLPEGSGEGRAPDLSNLLTESISKITVNKTLLPSQPSSGTGSFIEIETKSPLDRPHRYVNLSVQGSQRERDFSEDYLLSGTLSGVFGTSESFGLSASVQFRTEDIKRINYSAGTFSGEVGQYFPLADDGTPLTNLDFLDPLTPFPFEPGIDEIYSDQISSGFNGAEQTDFSLALSAQWNIVDHTDLRFDYTAAREVTDTFSRTQTVSIPTRYTPLAVPELGGRVRHALVWEDTLASFGRPGLQVFPRQSYAVARDIKKTTDTFSLRGDSVLGKWTFDYTLGAAIGKNDTPFEGQLSLVRPFVVGGNPLDPDFLLPIARENTVDGRIVHLYAPLGSNNDFPTPLINDAGFEFLNNPNDYVVDFGSIQTGNAGENTRYTVDFSTRYDFSGSVLKYLTVGAFYEASEFRSLPIESDQRLTFRPSDLSVLDLGLDFADESLSLIDQNGGLSVIRQSDLDAFFSGVANSTRNIAGLEPSPSPAFDPRRQETFTAEDTFDSYIEGRFDIGDLEIVGGIRINHVSIKANNLINASLFTENFAFDFDFQERFSRFIEQNASETSVLPRVAATYRLRDDLLFRAGYYKSVERPQIQNLSDEQTITVFLAPFSGPNFDQPSIEVSQGNPNLEPASTDNFDISFEYYFGNVGQIKISAFYKDISNLLELTQITSTNGLDGVDLPDDPRIQALENPFVFFTTPVNSEDDASVWGFETVFEKQLTFLSGFLGGLGVFANYTYTNSSKTQVFLNLNPNTGDFDSLRIDDVRFSQDPEHTGTIAITYNKYNVDASFSYTVQGRRLGAFDRFNLSSFSERDDSLDFRAEYRFSRPGSDWRVWIQGSDLLKSPNDPDVETSIGGIGRTPKYFTGGNFFGGRKFTLGMSATF